MERHGSQVLMKSEIITLSESDRQGRKGVERAFLCATPAAQLGFVKWKFTDGPEHDNRVAAFLRRVLDRFSAATLESRA